MIDNWGWRDGSEDPVETAPFDWIEVEVSFGGGDTETLKMTFTENKGFRYVSDGGSLFDTCRHRGLSGWEHEIERWRYRKNGVTPPIPEWDMVAELHWKQMKTERLIREAKKMLRDADEFKNIQFAAQYLGVCAYDSIVEEIEKRRSNENDQED